VTSRAAFVLDPWTGELRYGMVTGNRLAVSEPLEPIPLLDMSAPAALGAALRHVVLEGVPFAAEFDLRALGVHPSEARGAADELGCVRIRFDIFAVSAEKATEVYRDVLCAIYCACRTTCEERLSRRDRRRLARQRRRNRLGCRRIEKTRYVQALDVDALLAVRAGLYVEAVAKALKGRQDARRWRQMPADAEVGYLRLGEAR
jgi:hypothetical protein